jgi:EmrB/QacA subfamily drug resistance transporter
MTDVTATAPRSVTSAPTERTERFSLAALLTLITGGFLPILSFFILNVALPSIGADLHASDGALQLVIGSYGIANATLVVVGGRLGDGYGRRKLFITGMAAFTITSLLCALAPNVGLLLAARVAQGAAAALMVPQVLATIAATLTGESRARAIGLFGASGGVAAALGQILGGALVEADIAGLGWRTVFLLNVPLGLVALAAARRLLPETRATHRLPLDLAGATILATTLVALLLPLTEGRPLGWPLWTWLLLIAALPLGIGLGLHQSRLERSERSPLVPPSVLKLRGMRIGLGIALPFFTTFSGFMFAFALATQVGAHLSALEAGLAILPMGVAFLVASIVGPRLETRWGPGIMTRGALIEAVGYLVLAATTWLAWPDINALVLTPGMLITGLGTGFVMMPMFGVVVRQVPVQQAGLGSGILITTQQTCLAMGAAIVGTAYLSMAQHWGARDALIVVELGIAVVSAALTLLSRQLEPAS